MESHKGHVPNHQPAYVPHDLPLTMPGGQNPWRRSVAWARREQTSPTNVPWGSRAAQNGNVAWCSLYPPKYRGLRWVAFKEASLHRKLCMYICIYLYMYCFPSVCRYITNAASQLPYHFKSSHIILLTSSPSITVAVRFLNVNPQTEWSTRLGFDCNSEIMSLGGLILRKTGVSSWTKIQVHQSVEGNSSRLSGELALGGSKVQFNGSGFLE